MENNESGKNQQVQSSWFVCPWVGHDRSPPPENLGPLAALSPKHGDKGTARAARRPWDQVLVWAQKLPRGKPLHPPEQEASGGFPHPAAPKFIGGSSSAALPFPSALMDGLARPTSHLPSHNLAKASSPKTSPFGEAREGQSELLLLFQAANF